MAKVRVYELAIELDLTSKEVLNVLKDMGEFVRSASSTVEPPVERRLKERLAGQPVKRARPRPEHKAAARELGDEIEINSEWFYQGLRQPPKPRADTRQSRRTTPKRRSPAQIEADHWARFMFDAEAADEWKAGGIWEPELASRCVEAGLPASALGIRVDGRRVGERLENGEHISVVLNRLRDAGWKADAS